jgi:hypothetical protein
LAETKVSGDPHRSGRRLGSEKITARCGADKTAVAFYARENQAIEIAMTIGIIPARD